MMITLVLSSFLSRDNIMRGMIYLIIATILAAIGWGASKMVVMTIPGDIFIGTRFLLASFVLAPFCFKQFRTLTGKQILALSGLGWFYLLLYKFGCMPYPSPHHLLKAHSS